jgi:endonuclease/exonuclease/phosphatase family metal-dependent hydrolase
VPGALLGRPKPAHPVVLAGDFNLQHPLWDEFERYERKAEDLLQLSSQWNLAIRTPKGTVTRTPQGRQRGRTSTIDHFWTSEGLQTVYYGEECRGKSDHYPQVLEVGEGEGPRPAQPDVGRGGKWIRKEWQPNQNCSIRQWVSRTQAQTG